MEIMSHIGCLHLHCADWTVCSHFSGNIRNIIATTHDYRVPLTTSHEANSTGLHRHGLFIITPHKVLNNNENKLESRSVAQLLLELAYFITLLFSQVMHIARGMHHQRNK